VKSVGQRPKGVAVEQTEQKRAASTHSGEQSGYFTAFDLLFLLVRDGSLVACAVVGWRLGGWPGAVAGVPVGWAIGWVMRYVVALLLAVADKLLLGGTLWGSRDPD
jgi:hypothetical protein